MVHYSGGVQVITIYSSRKYVDIFRGRFLLAQATTLLYVKTHHGRMRFLFMFRNNHGVAVTDQSVSGS